MIAALLELEETRKKATQRRVAFFEGMGVNFKPLPRGGLLVTVPNGYSQLAAFAGADLSMNGSPLTGSHSIPTRKDIFGFVNPSTPLDTFTVAISEALPGTMAVAATGGLFSSGTVGGPFTAGAIRAVLRSIGVLKKPQAGWI